MKYRSWAEIDLKVLTENINKLQSFLNPKTKYLQVVKADAYGHGAIEVARVALNNDAEFLGVANADEGIQLRLAEISSPILILSPSTDDEIPGILKYKLTPSLSSFDFAKKLSDHIGSSEKVPVHLEVDTGMGRTGLRVDNAEKEIKKIAKLKNLNLEGIFSHFPSSELENDSFAKDQINKFNNLVSKLKKSGLKFKYIHMANSGGIINYNAAQFNMVRAGLLSFGEYPGDSLRKKIKVNPVMSFNTKVILVKRFKKGETVSYCRTYTVKKDTHIAILPIGYADGYDFLLSNRGEVLINGRRFPIVGRVTMDLTMVDIGNKSSVKVGDQVILIGKSGSERITAEDIAVRAGSLNYFVLCSVGKRAPRIYINQKKLVKFRPILRRKDITGNLISREKLDEIIKHSLQLRLNEEVGNSLFHGIFQSIFGINDEAMVYRKDFEYKIKFIPHKTLDKFFTARISIKYIKIFKESEIIVGCTNTEKRLEKLFVDPRVEYRWLLEKQGKLDFSQFKIKHLKLNGKEIKLTENRITPRGVEYTYLINERMDLLNKPVEFSLEFETIHPKDKKEFPVYIVHPTKGFKVIFDFGIIKIKKPNVFPFFSGKVRYPSIKKGKKQIEITASDKDWIFPNSGLLIYWA